MTRSGSVCHIVLFASLTLVCACRQTHEGINAEARETAQAPTPGGVDPGQSKPATTATPPPPSTPRKYASGAPSRHAVALALGTQHSCALLDDENAVCWGAGNLGQLGSEAELEVCTTPDYTGPCARNPVAVGAAKEVSRIVAGTATTCFVTNGRVFCAGAGPLGFPTPETCPRLPAPVPCFPVPDRVRGIDDALELAVGGAHACAITRNGVQCWGDSSSLQLGRETGTVEAIEIPGLTGATAIAAGDRHTCVIIGGEVRCWGANERAQLGLEADEDTPALAEPIVIEGLREHPVLELTAGNAHTCARTDDGKVWCWGSNQRGQLGDGTFVDRAEPAMVSLPRAALQIAAGDAHTCALQEDGEIYCWGANDGGQLGDASNDDRGLPTEVTDVDVAEAIAAGARHTCAIIGDEMRCWGANDAFQLARPQDSPGATPAAVIW